MRPNFLLWVLDRPARRHKQPLLALRRPQTRTQEAASSCCPPSVIAHCLRERSICDDEGGTPADSTVLLITMIGISAHSRWQLSVKLHRFSACMEGGYCWHWPMHCRRFIAV